MTKVKKKGSAGKVIAGATLLAAAGAAAVLVNKKNRKRLEAKAKKTVSELRANPKVKKVGNDAGDFIGRVGQAIKNFFK